MSTEKNTNSQHVDGDGRAQPWCPVTVEPLLVIIMIGLIASVPTNQQYIYNLVGNGTLPQNTSSCDVNVSDPAYQRQNEAQAVTSQWTLYNTLATSVPGTVSSVLLGTVSDTFGRKVVLIVPAVGGLISALTTTLVIYFSLPLEIMVAGNFVFGLMGGWTASIGGCFAYIADITDPGKQRTFRVALLESGIGISSLVAEIGAGYWIRGRGIPRGFEEVYLCIVGSSVFSVLYPLTLKETRPKGKKDGMVSCGHFRTCFKVFNEKRYDGRRRKLLLGTLAYLLTMGGAITATNLFVLYVLGSPFCFTSDLVGLLKAATGATFLISVVCIRVFNRCVSEFALMMVAFASFFAGMVLLAFAGDFRNVKPEVAVFMVPVVMMFRMMIPPILKTILSREVAPNEQGTLFAVLTSTDSVGNVIFSLMFNNIYSSTVGFMRGFVFLLTAGIVVIAAGLVGAMQYWEPKHGYKPVKEETADTEEPVINVIND